MQPPFTLLHHVPGKGDVYAGVDVSYALLQYGQWQAGNVVSYAPHLAERLMMGLATAAARAAGAAGSSASTGAGQLPALLDIGAGYGMMSLAAASRGHPVLAFEAAPQSAWALAASIEYNGFPDTILVHRALGDRTEHVCLDAHSSESLPAAQQEAAQHGYATPSVQQPAAGCKHQAQRSAAADAVTAALPTGESLH